MLWMVLAALLQIPHWEFQITIHLDCAGYGERTLLPKSPSSFCGNRHRRGPAGETCPCEEVLEIAPAFAGVVHVTKKQRTDSK
jgi:hypothetical protein